MTAVRLSLSGLQTLIGSVTGETPRRSYKSCHKTFRQWWRKLDTVTVHINPSSLEGFERVVWEGDDFINPDGDEYYLQAYRCTVGVVFARVHPDGTLWGDEGVVLPDHKNLSDLLDYFFRDSID
jgi:hypothetical protein